MRNQRRGEGNRLLQVTESAGGQAGIWSWDSDPGAFALCHYPRPMGAPCPWLPYLLPHSPVHSNLLSFILPISSSTGAFTEPLSKLGLPSFLPSTSPFLSKKSFYLFHEAIPQREGNVKVSLKRQQNHFPSTYSSNDCWNCMDKKYLIKKKMKRCLLMQIQIFREIGAWREHWTQCNFLYIHGTINKYVWSNWMNEVNLGLWDLNRSFWKPELGCFCWIALRRCSSARKTILSEYI